jgi:uncharacterized membrane protein
LELSVYVAVLFFFRLCFFPLVATSVGHHLASVEAIACSLLIYMDTVFMSTWSLISDNASLQPLHKAQGQTIDYVIVDIAPTPQFNVTPFAAYVGLSRSRGRDTIHLLRDFDDKIFPRHPSQDLRVEDERLQWLADDTGKRFETGFYDYA